MYVHVSVCAREGERRRGGGVDANTDTPTFPCLFSLLTATVVALLQALILALGRIRVSVVLPPPPPKKKRTGARACASFRQRQTSKLTSNENCCSHVQVLDSSRRSYVFFFFITCLGGLVQALVGVSICPCCFLASFVFQLSPSIILRIRLFFLHTHTHTHSLSRRS